MQKDFNIDEIIIEKGLENQIFDSFFSCNKKKRVFIRNHSSLKYFCYWNSCDIDIEFLLDWENTSVDVYCIFSSNNNDKSKVNIKTLLANNNVKANVYIISFLTDWWTIDVKADIDIWKNIKWASWHLLEENVLLWNKISVKSLPILNVSSNDVSASHWAKISKIDTDKIFYMMSKWISLIDSKRLILNWYFDYIFSSFDIEDDKKQNILKNFLEHIKL